MRYSHPEILLPSAFIGELVDEKLLNNEPIMTSCVLVCMQSRLGEIGFLRIQVENKNFGKMVPDWTVSYPRIYFTLN